MGISTEISIASLRNENKPQTTLVRVTLIMRESVMWFALLCSWVMWVFCFLGREMVHWMFPNMFLLWF